MKSELIHSLTTTFEAHAQQTEGGVEYWLGRDLQHLLGYRAIVVEPEAWAVELSRYVHLNPVRVGELGLGKASRRRQALGVDVPPTAAEVRERLRRLRSHQWSSYRAYVGPAKGVGPGQVRGPKTRN